MTEEDSQVPHFDPEYPAIGRLAASDALPRLRGAGADAIADEIEAEIDDDSSPATATTPLAAFSLFGTEKGTYVGTGFSLGFIPGSAFSEDGAPIEIVPATRLRPDASLNGRPLKIALDYLRATDYPGSGVHQVLFEFKGKHQTADAEVEALHFSQIFRVEEGAAAGVSGYPVFLGLHAGANGVGFHVSVTNVGNEDDQHVAKLLDSEVMTRGLKLLKTAQPAIAPLTDMALTIGKMFARRNENVRVQDVYVGLDFEPSPTSVRLALGSYVVVQLPAHHTEFEWSDYVYDPDKQRYVHRERGSQEIPYNFFVFRVSEYHE